MTPNQRFERTAASELAVPVSLRGTAASQARRYAAEEADPVISQEEGRL
jgi:hypothetical protein